jgi:hypothetical protein
MGGATGAANSITGTVGLVPQYVDIKDAEANATSATAASTSSAAVSAATAPPDEQGHDGTGREQLHVLTINLSKAHCIRHVILLRTAQWARGNTASAPADSANHHHGEK